MLWAKATMQRLFSKRIICSVAVFLLASVSYAQFPSGPSIPQAPSYSPPRPSSPRPSSPRPSYPRPSTPSYSPSRNSYSPSRPTTPSPGYRTPSNPGSGYRGGATQTPGGWNNNRYGGRAPTPTVYPRAVPNVGPVFRNPLVTQRPTPAYNPQTAIRKMQLPTMPGAPKASVNSPYSGINNLRTLRQQIESNLSKDKSLSSLMSAVHALNRVNANSTDASQYRTQAIQAAQGQIRAGNADAFAYTALGRLAVDSGNQTLFRETTNDFIAKYPQNPNAHLYKGMQALNDSNWAEAEKSLIKARELGIPEESIAELLKIAIDNQKWIWEYAEIICIVLAIWLVGLVCIYVSGSILSRITLRAIDADRVDDRSLGTRVVRRSYRWIVGLAGIYYYISLPLILVAAILLPLAIGYAALSTPYLNLVLLVLILVGGVGGIITAISGIRTAVLRVPDASGNQLQRHESARFWGFVESVAGDLETRCVDQIWLTPGEDMAVTERGSWWRRFRDRGDRVLILGAALLKGFRSDALAAVLAHEYAHFRNRDTAGGDIALRVQYSMQRFAEAIVERGKIRWWDITIHFLKIFHRMFTRLTLGASRLQEVLADRAAISRYGTQAFKEGLTHVIRRSVEFDRAVSSSINHYLEIGSTPANLFDSSVLDREDRATIEETMQAIFASKTTDDDSHPAPSERLAMADRMNVQREGLSPLASEYFDGKAEPLYNEMNDTLKQFVQARSEQIKEYNQLVIEYLTEVYRHDRSDMSVVVERSRLYYEMCDYERAAADLSTVLRFQNQPELRMARANCLAADGQPAKAVEDLKEVLKQVMKQGRRRDEAFLVDVHYELGKCYMELNSNTEAVEHLDAALELDPEAYRAIDARLELADRMGAADEEPIAELRRQATEQWPHLTEDYDEAGLAK